jgi:methionine-gamma-lyase
MKKTSDNRGFATRAIHAGERRDPLTNAHTSPIYQTATFSFETAEEMAQAIAEPFDHFFYSRTGNPTTAAAEAKLASLEGTEEALVASSGMAAVAVAILSRARSGDHVIVGEDLFIISRQFFEQECPEMGLEVTFVDITDLEAVRRAIRPNTKVLFTESVSNPRMQVADLPALAQAAHEASLSFVVDNTFLSPYLLRPAELGADLVLHSATKYLSGHGDTIAGVLAGDRDSLRRARSKLDALGQCLSPMNAWLLLRGIRTLPLRLRQHSANAASLAQYLERHDKVEWVRYPGLASHPQHQTARSLLGDTFGGMLSFKVKGEAREMNRFANALRLGALGVSLGDVFTLVYPQPRRGNLIRVSVGCEDPSDIRADFEQALSRL